MEVATVATHTEARGIHRRLLIVVTGGVLNRFFEKIDRSGGPDACWPWTGADRGNGYGAIKIAGRVVSTHNLAWVIANGQIPEGLVVRHECDNRPCCNPAHLITGTPKQNVADMDGRGRRNGLRGEECHSSKLSREQVVEIRRLRSEGIGIRELGRRFGVQHSVIGRIVNRQSWKHVPAELTP